MRQFIRFDSVVAPVGVFGLLCVTMFWLLATFGCGQSESSRENVLLITIDTLRADHLGCYGYPRNTSPSIDEFAEKSVLFTQCVSQASSTLPSHASIFTSLYPPTHGVIHNLAALRPEIPSLVKVFRKHGYSTCAVVSNIVLESRFGLNQGFQTYDERLGSHELNRENFLERPANAATDAAINWLRTNMSDKFFLWVHYIDPHGAYYPPEEYRTLFVGDEWYSEGKEMPVSADAFAPGAIPKYQSLFGNTNPSYYVAQYDGEIRFTDREVGRLLRFIEETGLMKSTIVVLTADHGETMTERDYCFTHTFRTYDELTRIPLIMHFPNSELRKRVGAQVRAIDIMPTLLDKLSLKNPYEVHGQSLMKLIIDGEGPTPELVVSYSDYGIPSLEDAFGFQRSVRTPRWKFIRNLPRGPDELYNLEKDPAETANLARSELGVLRQMRETFAEWERAVEQGEVLKPALSKERIEQLESLGYLAK
jgi:arylsulfatase A-like enzyme